MKGEEGFLKSDIKMLDENIIFHKVASKNNCAWINEKKLNEFEIKQKKAGNKKKK